jgi:hypothetical protein
MGGKTVLENYLNDPTDDGDYVQYMDWTNNSTKQAFEGLGEVTGWSMPAIALPAPVRTLAHDPLLAAKATVGGLDQSTTFADYRRRTLADNVSYMERVAAYGDEFARQYLHDAAEILGHRPRDVVEADEELERYVLAADPREDERLFTVLSADTLRRCLLLAIPGSTYYDGLTKPVQPLS